MRGLYWVRYNRPLGIDTLASHWALNDKGDLKNEMVVTIENDFGIVTRKRTKNDNQYIVNGKVLDVVKSDVPAEVEQVLCLSDTNIQKQLDEPFLLSKSSGEVAKYFNKVVRLDVIDRVLTNAETTRRKTQNDIKNVQAQIKDCEDKLQAFEWLDDAEILIEKHERVSNRKNQIESDVMLYNDPQFLEGRQPYVETSGSSGVFLLSFISWLLIIWVIKVPMSKWKLDCIPPMYFARIAVGSQTSATL